jgi:hypothetical protein
MSERSQGPSPPLGGFLGVNLVVLGFYGCAVAHTDSYAEEHARSIK